MFLCVFSFVCLHLSFFNDYIKKKSQAGNVPNVSKVNVLSLIAKFCQYLNLSGLVAEFV